MCTEEPPPLSAVGGPIWVCTEEPPTSQADSYGGSRWTGTFLRAGTEPYSLGYLSATC